MILILKLPVRVNLNIDRDIQKPLDQNIQKPLTQWWGFEHVFERPYTVDQAPILYQKKLIKMKKSINNYYNDVVINQPEYHTALNNKWFFGMGGWYVQAHIINKHRRAYAKKNVVFPLLRRTKRYTYLAQRDYYENGVAKHAIYSLHPGCKSKEKMLKWVTYLINLDSIPDLTRFEQEDAHPRFKYSCKTHDITMQRVQNERMRALNWLHENAELTTKGWRYDQHFLVPQPAHLWLTVTHLG